MAHLRILQHHPAEDPGAIVEWARMNGHVLEILQPSQQVLPQNHNGVDGLILLGGPWCAFADDLPDWLHREQDWIGKQLTQGMPIFAICLGAQLLAQALGANLQRMPTAETGWVEVDVLEPSVFDQDQTSRRRLDVLQWHEDCFDLPPGCICIAINAAASAATNCPIQAYTGGNGRIVGLQFHPEWTAGNVTVLHAAFGDDCPLPKTSAAARYEQMHAWLYRRLDRWLGDSGRS
jgi:GMP synthase-like glutamine amidotransferase